MDNVKDFPENIEEEILKECLEIAVNELVKEDDYFTPASIFSALRKIKAHAKDQSDKKRNILEKEKGMRIRYLWIDEMHILGTAMNCARLNCNADEYHPYSKVGGLMVQFAKISRIVKLANQLDFECDFDDYSQSIYSGTNELINKAMEI